MSFHKDKDQEREQHAVEQESGSCAETPVKEEPFQDPQERLYERMNGYATKI